MICCSVSCGERSSRIVEVVVVVVTIVGMCGGVVIDLLHQAAIGIDYCINFLSRLSLASSKES